LPFIINTEAKSKLSDEPVARLDGKAITKIDLVGYIKKTENKQYNDLLSSSEGLKKLAGYYIQRHLLLTYAKEVINKEDRIFKNHLMQSDEETAYLIMLLKKEVNDKTTITNDEIITYMNKNNIHDEQAAKSQLLSDKRQIIMKALIKKASEGHSIEYLED
jgi:hypothetical protein